MLSWIKRALARADRPAAVPAPARLTAATPAAEVRAWCLALGQRCHGDDATIRAALAAARPELDGWFAAHPITATLVSSVDGVRVHDPLDLTTDELLGDGREAPTLVPWASLQRSLVVTTGGRSYHHGLSLADVVALLGDPWMPARIEALTVPRLDGDDATYDADLDRLVEALVTTPALATMRHLTLAPPYRFGVRHLARLVEAPWAATLRSLDITELMNDWSVDLPEEERHQAMRALGRCSALTHLGMYNNVGTASDLEVLLRHAAPSLTHLELGSMNGVTGAWREALTRLAPTTALELVTTCDGPAWPRPPAAA